jgi:uncharacterized membrane protein YfcA
MPGAVFLWKHAGMTTTLIIAAILSGAFIGAVLGFIGAGGAMITVPLLIYIFNFTPLQATTAALAVVFSAAAASLIPKFKSKDVLLKEALTIWALGLITNIGFGTIADSLPDKFILIGFSTVLIGAGISMIRAPIKDHPEKKISFFYLIALSLIIGALTGLFGIGGGFVAIPVLVLFFHTPQNKAAGTSLLIITLNCATAFLAKYQSWSAINWHYPVLIALVAILIAQISSKLAPKAPTIHLKKAFACLLFVIAGFTLITKIFG